MKIVVPGHNESAGKRKSAKTKKGNKYLRSALTEAAHSVRGSKNYLGALYRRTASRNKEEKGYSLIPETDKLSGLDWIQEVLNLYYEHRYEEAESVLCYQKENGNSSQDLIYHLAYVSFNLKRYYDSLNQIEKIDIDRVEAIRRDGFKENVFSLKAKIYIELKKYDKQ